MFDWLKRKKKDSILACERTRDCPYEYDKDQEREIEGMPFPAHDDDPRRCPQYGHICPEFMEHFGLTVDELRIRATIHCANIAMGLVGQGKRDEKSPEHIALMNEVHRIFEKYPPDDNPRYYEPVISEKTTIN